MPEVPGRVRHDGRPECGESEADGVLWAQHLLRLLPADDAGGEQVC